MKPTTMIAVSRDARVILVCVAMCLGSAACSKSSERRVIETWLECTECSDDLLDAVSDQGRSSTRTVDRLGRALGDLDEKQLEFKRAHFAANYSEIVAEAARSSRQVTATRQEYISRRLSNYVETRRYRAARALGRIGTTDALEELEDALERDALGLVPLSDKVLREIHRDISIANRTLSWHAIALDSAHTCGISTSGEAVCWGDNSESQLGDGTTDTRSEPDTVATRLRFASIDVGGGRACAITRTGRAYCWGDNELGRLGDGSATDRSRPTGVRGAFRFRSIALGLRHSCADSVGGAVYCWGWNEFGQLGDGSQTDRLTPRRVATQTQFAVLSAGAAHTCAVTASGEAYCWGSNAYGQLGLPGAGAWRPTSLRSPLRFRALSAGEYHTCGVTTDALAYCWGRNESGQLGTGSTNASDSPTLVAGGLRFQMVSAGGGHTCGVTVSDELYCWGGNESGQLGDSTTSRRLEPVAVSGPAIGFTSVHAGGRFTCAIASSGQAYCWGSNQSGQLGVGQTSARELRPAEVVFLASR
jgi:alpha-tubulin suppressor-like RCC1 family protein